MTRDYVRSSQPAKRKPAAKAPCRPRKAVIPAHHFPWCAVLALALVIGFGIFRITSVVHPVKQRELQRTINATQAPIPIENSVRPKKNLITCRSCKIRKCLLNCPMVKLLVIRVKTRKSATATKMQEMLRAQQERARLLVQQQTVKLPADDTPLRNQRLTPTPRQPSKALIPASR